MNILWQVSEWLWTPSGKLINNNADRKPKADLRSAFMSHFIFQKLHFSRPHTKLINIVWLLYIGSLMIASQRDLAASLFLDVFYHSGSSIWLPYFGDDGGAQCFKSPVTAWQGEQALLGHTFRRNISDPRGLWAGLVWEGHKCFMIWHQGEQSK